MRPTRFSMLFAACVLTVVIGHRFSAESHAQSFHKPIDFVRDVRPILQRHCVECHGASNAKGELRLDAKSFAHKGGSSGAAFVAGKGSVSELIRRVTLPKGDPEVMPARGDVLSSRQVDILKRWIDEGADWPDEVPELKHWSYEKPVRPAVPSVRDADWARGPLDRFVQGRLEDEGLQPSPEATRAALLRRVTLDLTGLPPSQSEIDNFENDSRPDSFERAIDRLLASPSFGEKWARHWLDLARYADSHGFQRDDLHELWAFRDWVIAALNDNMPFDRFTIEQVAGDLMENSEDESAKRDPSAEARLIATGFHRCSPTNVEAGSDPEETRVNQLIDRVNTTAAVWLGTTLECAQCHDHKYDPFTQRDYYGLLAFFNGTEIEADRSNPKVPGSIRFLGPKMPLRDDVHAEERSLLTKKFREAKAIYEACRAKLEADLDEWAAANSGSIPAKLKVKPEKRNKKQTDALLDHRIGLDPEVKRLRDERDELDKQLRAIQQGSTLVMREMAAPRATSIFQRGDFRTPGDPVTATIPAIFVAKRDSAASASAISNSAGSGEVGDVPAAAGVSLRPLNRLDLARWLVSFDNPLVGRVTVNRWWAEVFGRGLVTTVEDFGIKGEPPSHPELLDWLAIEFTGEPRPDSRGSNADRSDVVSLAEAGRSAVEHRFGYDIKRTLRQIVSSATYRQSSRVTADLLARDDQNRLLARGPRFRLDAETIRDQALAAAGLLSSKQFGPPVRPYQPAGLWTKVGGTPLEYNASPGEDRYRRGIYVVWKRASPYPSFVAFDATARLACTVKRSRSNTPLQALALLNDPVYVEAAFGLARASLNEAPSASNDSRLRTMFVRTLSREPTSREADVLMKLFTDQFASLEQDDRRTQQIVGAEPLPGGITAAEFAAWQSVATAILNLDETITKP